MVAYRIKELREAKGISQEALAKKSKVSRAIISELESGRDKITTTDTLAKLAKALEVEVGDIFFVK